MSLDRGEGEEPVQREERFVFQGLSASGYARQHNGNVYNNYAYNYTIRKRKSDETLQEDQRNKQLLKAAAAGHTPRVRYLIHLGADLDFCDGDGYTALHHAALSGFEDTVEHLLNAGADVAAPSLDTRTPLHLAALKGRMNVARTLLDYRADPNAQSPSVGSPLHCASAGGSAQVVSELLRRGTLVHSVATIDFRLVQSTIPSSRQDWMAYAWDCQPLFVAASSGSLEVLNALLDAGASIDCSAQRRPKFFGPSLTPRKPLPEEPSMASQLGTSSLSLSIIRDMPEVTELLLKRGASVTAQLLCDAASFGRDRCLRALMQYAQSLDLVDAVNGTALMGAASSDHIGIAQILIDAGASVNLKTSHTALHVATIFAGPEMIRSLLEWGADPGIENWQGRNALDVARFAPDGSPRPREFDLKLRILENHVGRPAMGTPPTTIAHRGPRENVDQSASCSISSLPQAFSHDGPTPV